MRRLLTSTLLPVAVTVLCSAISHGGPVGPGGTTFLGMSRLESAVDLSVGRVSSGGPDWSTLTGQLLLRSEPAAETQAAIHPRVVALNVQRAARFGQQDSQLGAAAAVALRRYWTVETEVSGSPTHRFLPTLTADAGLTRVLGSGWVAGGRLRHREYRQSIVDGAAVSLEKYAGPFRTLYEVSSSKVRGAGANLGHHLAADWFYGVDPWDRVRLAFSFGKQVEGVAASGVVTTSVRDGSLIWQQRLDGRWAIESGFAVSDHGSLYLRREIQLGLRRCF